MKAALITCSRMPDLHPDDELMAPILKELAVETVVVDWTHPFPSDIDAIWLRTPWDYHRQLPKFLEWLESTGDVPMWNSREVVRWNSHKRYVGELYEAGLPVVPTLIYEPEQPLDEEELKSWLKGQPVVVKPAVSAGAYKTARYDEWNEAAATHARELHAEEAVMIQPYFANIEKHGERSLIFLDGNYSHAVRRHLPLVEGPEVDYLMQPVEASAAELEAAQKILAYLPFPDLLYARVDLIPDPEGKPVLLELELIEPQLFLREHPEGAPVLARAFARRLTQLQRGVKPV
jgi:glutathione synthase/RimK-type ligase-like ATP-grasp enzyme